MNTADNGMPLDVIDLCEMWLRLDYPDIGAVRACAKSLPETFADARPEPVKSSYRSPAPPVQGP